MVFGYVRVSSRDQNEARQLVAMCDLGIRKQNIFVERQSGKDFNRPRYIQMLGKLRKDDLLVVKSIDRLGRNYSEILEQWRYITKTIGAHILVLDMPILDTRKGKDLTGTLIADIVLELLSYVAQTERDFIRSRQREGIDAAKARGVRFGRKPIQPPLDFREYVIKWKTGQISSRDAGKALGVAHTTFLAWVKKGTPP